MFAASLMSRSVIRDITSVMISFHAKSENLMHMKSHETISRQNQELGTSSKSSDKIKIKFVDSNESQRISNQKQN